ncbi:uncharacterized protein LOC111137778 [Crassostrea virginica]
MHCLKFLVVFLAVLQGSLSRRPTDDDDLRAVVEGLERLAERGLLRPRGGPSSNPRRPGDGSMDFTKPPKGPGGFKDKSWKQWEYLNNYYGQFPRGEYTWEMPLDMDYFRDLAYAWYSTGFPNGASDRMKAFSNITTEILNSHFQCATMKINQMVFYVLKEREGVMMADEDNSMYTLVRRVLESHVTDTQTREMLSKKIVSRSHSFMFQTIMNQVKIFQFKGFAKILKRMKRFMSTTKTTWTAEEFYTKMNNLMEKTEFNLECPNVDDLWLFHKKISILFQKRFAGTWHFRKAEYWVTNVLKSYMTSDPAPVVQQILAIYKGYIAGAIRKFGEVEGHMKSGNTADILQFVSQFLSSDQLAYLRSIFDDLGGDEGSFTDSPDVTDFPGVTDSPDVTDFPGDTDDTDTEGSGQNEIDDEDDVNDADNNPELN